MKIDQIEKVTLGFYPTPLHDLPNLTKTTGKARLMIKRDDLTGLGFGGNKLRKLEYIVKDALNEGATTLMTYGGVHTNHGRLTAAAACRYGLKSIIMCYGTPPETASGNIILDKMMGSEIVFIVISTSLGWSLFKRMKTSHYIGMLIFFGIGIVYWFIRTSYLKKKKNIDLVSNMKGLHPYWLELENKVD